MCSLQNERELKYNIYTGKESLDTEPCFTVPVNSQPEETVNR